jgi:hypothetical protein
MRETGTEQGLAAAAWLTTTAWHKVFQNSIRFADSTPTQIAVPLAGPARGDTVDPRRALSRQERRLCANLQINQENNSPQTANNGQSASMDGWFYSVSFDEEVWGLG